MASCVFCKIVSKELPSEIVYDSETILGFKDINPEAPAHFLFVPKKHLEWSDEFSVDDERIIGRLVAAAREKAAEIGINQACKLIFNMGKTGNVSHIHLHLLGGWEGKIPQHNI